MDNKPLKPAETLEVCINTGIAKANSSIGRLVVLGILAGAFIALAAQGSTMAAFNLIADPKTLGVGKALQGAVFGTGLIMVVLAGGELFTGNVLILASVAEKKVTLAKLLRNWVIVYIANLIGSLLVAWLISQSGQWAGGADALGGMTVKIAAGKTALSFGPAFILGIFCNWLVCVAVWLSFASESFIGKIFGIFFPQLGLHTL
jgi:formate/nitrite transporter